MNNTSVILQENGSIWCLLEIMSNLEKKGLSLVVMQEEINIRTRKKKKKVKMKIQLHLTASKGQQNRPKTPSSEPLLGRETQQLHEKWNSSHPHCRVHCFSCKLETHLSKKWKLCYLKWSTHWKFHFHNILGCLSIKAKDKWKRHEKKSFVIHLSCGIMNSAHIIKFSTESCHW